MLNFNSLREWRESLNMDQTEFAVLIGEDRGNYSKRESGRSGKGTVTADFISKVEDAVKSNEELKDKITPELLLALKGLAKSKSVIEELILRIEKLEQRMDKRDAQYDTLLTLIQQKL